jgi:hypothetical protein
MNPSFYFSLSSFLFTPVHVCRKNFELKKERRKKGKKGKRRKEVSK